MMRQQLVERMAEQMDKEDVRDMMLNIIEDKLYPHLEEIKARREKQDEEYPQDEVRQSIENMSAERREELFHTTMADLIVEMARLRVEPVKSARTLRGFIRNPKTIEGLALIMDREAVFSDRDEDEVMEAQKDTLITYLHWMGVALAPEMYERDEVEDMIEDVGGDPEILDKWDEYHERGEAVDKAEGVTDD